MTVRYTDQQIEALMHEQKSLPADWRKRTRMVSKRGHQEQHLDVTGVDGNNFRLVLRQSNINKFDFSVILAVIAPRSNRIFRIRRYNGKSHEHTNHIEGRSFYDFHIHRATERYQEIGAREDAYAEATDRYGTFYDALRCLFADAHFEVPAEPQRDLFQEHYDVD